MVKAGTISFDAYSGTYRFQLEDHDGNFVNVIYRGTLQFETKEGESVVLSGYLPDSNNKTNVIATQYMTNHSLEAEKWDGKIFLS